MRDSDGRQAVLRHERNLHTAFRRFRDAPLRLKRGADRGRWAFHRWIHAICFNQEDADERNSQVALMTRFCQLARTCHVWLGEGADDSARAMGLVKLSARKSSLYHRIRRSSAFVKPAFSARDVQALTGEWAAFCDHHEVSRGNYFES